MPGLAEHARDFNSLPEAIALRNHGLRTLERAEIPSWGAFAAVKGPAPPDAPTAR